MVITAGLADNRRTAPDGRGSASRCFLVAYYRAERHPGATRSGCPADVARRRLEEPRTVVAEEPRTEIITSERGRVARRHRVLKLRVFCICEH